MSHKLLETLHWKPELVVLKLKKNGDFFFRDSCVLWDGMEWNFYVDFFFMDLKNMVHASSTEVSFDSFLKDMFRCCICFLGYVLCILVFDC